MREDGAFTLQIAAGPATWSYARGLLVTFIYIHEEKDFGGAASPLSRLRVHPHQ